MHSEHLSAPGSILVICPFFTPRTALPMNRPWPAILNVSTASWSDSPEFTWRTGRSIIRLKETLATSKFVTYPCDIDTLAQKVVSDLDEAGFGVSENPNVTTAKGTKMIGNLGNALSAISDGKGHSGPYIDRARREGKPVSSRCGRTLEDSNRLWCSVEGKAWPQPAS